MTAASPAHRLGAETLFPPIHQSMWNGKRAAGSGEARPGYTERQTNPQSRVSRGLREPTSPHSNIVYDLGTTKTYLRVSLTRWRAAARARCRGTFSGQTADDGGRAGDRSYKV
ncbi:uncharacterized protein SPPG_08788 [Spizellomyces punctatus DAOM BR117]|uniref:Uncharacterized protein n=1 Tax=Spizellomyces punctatus (strain DAOM BR117) TaxID=645134 RepID=A0A0L0H4Z5_SPIPD|nr:uncharacterized protein SPPG_08788 [Spizellomyces punctatus DAOM BR117]KNC95793.1 hypothetical protein SPPG_08788 [Spizellomyces punctatus DAOM BR117]|eukprot:XP_016603833.1 hypothetical protein SPPG_08788 [Spizellomyces punctatus DAOM BR117]